MTILLFIHLKLAIFISTPSTYCLFIEQCVQIFNSWDMFVHSFQWYLYVYYEYIKCVNGLIVSFLLFIPFIQGNTGVNMEVFTA